MILDVLVLVRIEYIAYSRKVSILNNNKKVTDYTRYLIVDFQNFKLYDQEIDPRYEKKSLFLNASNETIQVTLCKNDVIM